MRTFNRSVAALRTFTRSVAVALLFAALPAHAIIKNPPNAAPGAPGSGTVTSVSVATANGFKGTVATATTTPAISIGTTVTGLLVGNGSSVAAAAWSDVQALLSGTCNSSTLVHGNGSCALLVSGDIPANLQNTAVTVVATTNQANTGTPTIDGFATTAAVSIVLDTAQSTASQNGPWVVQSGAWTRPAWYPSGGTTQVTGYSSVIVRQGTTYMASHWKQTNAAAITIDTTSTTWVLIQPAVNATTFPGVSRYIAQWGIPVIEPSSGSFGNNGVLTLTTALNTTYPVAWMYFPAGAIVSGSAAGLYYTNCTTTTACVVCNNVLANSIPFTPAACTPFVTTGPGAYTQTVTALTLLTIPIAGNTIGANGGIRFNVMLFTVNNANVKSIQTQFGGSNSGAALLTSVGYTSIMRNIRNAGVTNKQLIEAVTPGIVASDWVQAGSGPSITAIDTTASQNLTLIFSSAAATDYIVCMGGTIELFAGS